jgi:hypothetical protein
MDESIVIIFAVVIIFSIFVGTILKKDENPQDSTAGRWGIKAGKFLSGDWGGESWGEKRKK